VLLKIDPDIEYSKGYPGFDGTITGSENGMPRVLLGRGWRFSDDQVQFRNTAVLDLSNAEDALLRNMKQKTRYNIRLAERKGVTVRPGQLSDIPALYQMYAETSVRDGFVIRAAEYYRRVWSTFLRPLTDHNQPGAEALIAEVEGQTVAGILVYYFAKRAYYLYGMSRAAHRDKMPNHLLQWEAIRGAKSQGSLLYDLWGAPDTPDESDPMWGVYRFKEGLGAEVVCTIGAWDFPTSVLWYAVYTRLVPRVLGLMRARGRRQVKEALGGP